MHQWNGYSNINGGLLLYDGEQEFTTKDNIKIQNWRSTGKQKL